MLSSPKTVSFISASGGVGKTTLSIFLAKWLLEGSEGRRVAPTRLLLVDLDPTAGLSLSLMREEEYQRHVDEGKTLVGLYQKRSRGVQVNIEEYVVPVNHEGHLLNIIIPGEELDLMVDELWRPGNPGQRFRKMLERSGLYTRYEYVIFDSAPFFDMRYTVLSLYASGKYVVVLRPSLVDFRRTIKMLRRLIGYADDFNLSTVEFLGRFLGVFNLAHSKTKESDALLDLGFHGTARGRSNEDEYMKAIQGYVEELKKLISVSQFIIPVKAEIARLNMKDARKDLQGPLNDLITHLGT
ncbi:MAG: ParA family protein [Infirmifilum sp.]